MTLWDQLKNEARQGPAELTISSGQALEIAGHFHSLMLDDEPSVEKLDRRIRGGELMVMGIPVRVAA